MAKMDGIKKEGGGGRFLKDLALGTAKSALLGVPGRGARRAVERASATTLSAGAERAASAYKRRRRRKKKERGARGGEAEVKKKMTGIGFYLMLGLAIIKDILDLLDFTLIGTIAIIIISGFVSFVIFFYLFYNNVKFTTKKIVTLSIQVLVENIVFLQILPTTAIGLILIRIFENNDLIKKAAESKFGGTLLKAV